MKARWNGKLSTMLLIGVSVVMVPKLAMALTPACTVIGNTATLAYKVGGIDQTNKNSNTIEFAVANKVAHTVTRVDASYKSVVPGATSQALTFRITNDGNADQRYKLTFVTQATSATDAFGGTDSFDATTPGIGALSTTTITTATVSPNGTSDNTIIATIPVGQVDGDIAGYALIATAYKVDGTTIETANSSSVTSSYGTCTIDVVLADVAGSDDTSGAKDGQHSVRHAYKAASSNLSFTKTATTMWDPINYDSTPKAIPGALVKYVVSITNSGASPATLTTITDGLNAALTMDPDLKSQTLNGATPTAESANGSGFKAVISGGTRAGDNSGLANGVAKFYTTTSSADGIDFSDPTITATMATLLPVDAGGGSAYTAGELKSGETIAITFFVYVD